MKRLEEIKVRDIMQRDVVQLDDAMPIERAIETLEEMEISGAPVVDGTGRLVGVLTKSDVSRSAHVRVGRVGQVRDGSMAGDGDDEDDEEAILAREDYSPAVLGGDTVGDWMSPRTVTIDPDASLQAVCKKMLADHIHRVIVVSGSKIEGIVTSFDVVRLVAERGTRHATSRTPASHRN